MYRRRLMKLLWGFPSAALFCTLLTSQATAQATRDYDGEWQAKVNCTESIHGNPPLDYEVKIEVKNGSFHDVFKTNQRTLDTRNDWLVKFSKNEVVVNIDGSNNQPQRWKYRLKGKLNSTSTIYTEGPFFDARGNKSRACAIVLTSIKPHELSLAGIEAKRGSNSAAPQEANSKQIEQRQQSSAQTATSSPVADQSQLEQRPRQENQAAIAAQAQATQRAEQEVARLKQELAQRDAQPRAQSPVADQSQLEQRLRQENQAAIAAQAQATQRGEQEVARLKQELAQRDAQLRASTSATEQSLREQRLRQESQAAIASQAQATQRAEQEVVRLKQENQTLTTNANSQLQQLASKNQSQAVEIQNLTSQIYREKELSSNLERSLSSSANRNLTNSNNFAPQLNDYSKNQTLNQNSNNTTIINQILQFVGIQSNDVSASQWAEVAHLRSNAPDNTDNNYDFEALISVINEQKTATASIPTFKDASERDDPMFNFLQAILTISGIIIVASIVVPTFDKQNKWTPLVGMLASFSFKIAAICLAAMEITVTYVITRGVLSFQVIGMYVACAAIIIVSVRDLFSGSNFLTNLAVVASHKANQMQDEINRKAAEMAESAKKVEAEKSAEPKK